MIEMNLSNEKVFFMPGDVVTIKHDIPNKPIMLVIGKESTMIKNENHFKGIKCQWFSTDMKLQIAIFSSKDIVHV